MMATMIDEEVKAARIDEATRDWLGSQVFPTTALISEGVRLRRLDEFVSPVKEPIVMSRDIFTPAGASMAA